MVLVAGRDARKTAEAVTSIRRETGNLRVEPLLADLAVQAEVRRLAHEVRDGFGQLHVLVNNAGAFYRQRRESADGIEMTLALNLLAPFLLTNLLLPTMQACAPARIVNVSSTVHRIVRIDFDDLEGKKRYSGMRAYGRAKLGLILVTYELARRLAGSGVTSNALHPGVVATNIGQAYGKAYECVLPLFGLVTKSPQEGARTAIYLASSPEVDGVTGRYFVEEKAVRSSPASHDAAAARRLWRVCATMTGLAASADP
jgi:NAD(P)-dependent dehydrogenase (short-subunit alcohol dehydrogenase family)